MALAAPRQQPAASEVLHVPLLGHLWAVAACAAAADLLMPGTLWLGALAYVVLQTARATLVLGAARAARRRGRAVRQVHLGPLHMRLEPSPRAINASNGADSGVYNSADWPRVR